MSDPDVYRRLAALERWKDQMASVELPITAEGTWTPTFGGTTTDGTITTYSVQAGSYVRVGRMVTAWCTLVIGAITVAPTGNLLIRGLPFTSRNTAIAHGGSLVQFNRFTLTAGAIQVQPRIDPGTNFLSFVESFSGGDGAYLSSAALGANAVALVIASYETE